MKRIKLLSIMVAAAILGACSVPASAQLLRTTAKVGTSAAQFLKIGAGARAMGMGGAQTAVGGDISAIYWNVAALSGLTTGGEATFNHAEWLADINYDFVAGVMQIGDLGTFGISLTSLGVPEDIVRTVQFPEGDGRRWDATSLAIGLSYARNLTDQFSIGFTAKYIHESLWNEGASGFAVDVGTLYRFSIRGLTLGATITNFGTSMKLDGQDLYFNNDPDGDVGGGPNNIPSGYRTESYSLPLTFRIGLAWDLYPADDFRLTPAIDATHPNDNTEYVNSGLEATWREIVFGRIGYKSLFLRDSEQGLTWGLGLHYAIPAVATVKLDYGFADYGRLENVHFVSVGLKF